MKTVKQISDKELRQLFAQMPQEQPSAGFTDRLMLRIEQESAKQAFRRRVGQRLLAAAAVAAVIIAPVFVLYFFAPEFSIKQWFHYQVQSIRIDSFVLISGIATLTLLIIDIVARSRLDARKRC
jgi:hypothetical protein